MFDLRLLLGCVFCLIFCPTDYQSLFADQPAEPPEPKALVDTYVGYVLDELHFFRLELKADGTGLLVSVANPDTIYYKYGPTVFRISKWRLTGFDFSIEGTPVKPKPWRMTMTGKVESGRVLRFRMFEDGKETALGTLSPEKRLLTLLKDTATAAQDATKQSP
jgi:hypothetical protein